ncbi:MAG: CcmD family protein [Deltaproteobacteria bacterium]|nr:CcmD family protein [Deltaproteobacteria bacterium]
MDTLCRTLPDLFWAYSAVWGLVVGYIVYLGLKLGRIEKSLRKPEK